MSHCEPIEQWFKACASSGDVAAAQVLVVGLDEAIFGSGQRCLEEHLGRVLSKDSEVWRPWERHFCERLRGIWGTLSDNESDILVEQVFASWPPRVLTACFELITRDPGEEWEKWERAFVAYRLHRVEKASLEKFAACCLLRLGWCPNTADPREVVADVCGTAFFEVVRNYKPEKGAFLAYLKCALKHYCSKWWHEKQRGYQQFPDHFNGCATEPSIEDRILADEVSELLAELSPKLREVVKMLREGWTMEEISRQGGVPAATLRARFRRAVRGAKLRLGLEERRGQ